MYVYIYMYIYIYMYTDQTSKITYLSDLSARCFSICATRLQDSEFPGKEAIALGEGLD